MNIWNETETALIEETLSFIMVAHKGQEYGDLPYWKHPKMVADALINPTIIEYIAALLHDVIEDTQYDDEAYLRQHFSDEIVDVVVLLSKNLHPDMSYQESIQNIIDSGNQSAMRVKLADNYVNISGDKSHMNEERKSRLFRKYTMSIEMLARGLNE